MTFEINDVNFQEAMMALCAGVKGLNGVRDVQFVGSGALVTFNPLGITKRKSAPRCGAPGMGRPKSKQRSLLALVRAQSIQPEVG